MQKQFHRWSASRSSGDFLEVVKLLRRLKRGTDDQLAEIIFGKANGLAFDAAILADQNAAGNVFRGEFAIDLLLGIFCEKKNNRGERDLIFTFSTSPL